MTYETFQLLSLDVWGNKREGFDVNDIHETGFFLELLPDSKVTPEKIINALKRSGMLKKRFRFFCGIFDENMITIDYKKTSEPVYQFRALHKDEAEEKKAGRWSFSAPLHFQNAIIYRETKNGILRRLA